MKMPRSKKAQAVVKVLRGRFHRSEFVDAREIAAYLPNSPQAVRATAGHLVKLGYLESRKGPNGGYRLNSPA
jgi:DNA-binding IscR family transcriptional regulator